MSYKKLIPFINGENELAANVVTMAEDYCFAGADELFLYNYSKITEERLIYHLLSACMQPV